MISSILGLRKTYGVYDSAIMDINDFSFWSLGVDHWVDGFLKAVKWTGLA